MMLQRRLHCFACLFWLVLLPVVLRNLDKHMISGHQWAVVALAHLITAMRGPLLVLVPPRRCHDGLWSVLRMLLLLASLQVSAGTGKIEND